MVGIDFMVAIGATIRSLSPYQEKTTFTCPYKTFAFKKMPLGLCDASVIFLCFMVLIFINVVEDIIEVLLDDIFVVGNSLDRCLKNLDEVVKICEDYYLVLNKEKCNLWVKKV